MTLSHTESPPPVIRLDGNGWGLDWPVEFVGHVATLAAWNPADVPKILAEAEQASIAGLHSVGFVSYEAAQALNPVLPSHAPIACLPLAWFALFREALQTEPLQTGSEPLPLQPVSDIDAYRSIAQRVLDYIAAGDCYQVNLTFPLSGRYNNEPASLYNHLLCSQPPTYGACINAGQFSILSLSPELFFRRKGEAIVTRPMKGTARRGRFPEEDRILAENLRDNPKELAENLMIVDLLRNDLGIVAETGSVRVPDLFTVESLPTVHQMTSSVTAQLRPDTPLVELMTALFPCGSVTGAPKRRAMEIIAELENRPRGIYCGAIGYLSPDGTTTFSVAIRTLFLDHCSQTALLGVGSGITSDSNSDDEFRECLAKGAFVTHPPPFVGLIESLRLEGNGYPFLERHLQRLAWSANRLGIPCNLAEARQLLENEAKVNGIRKVRLHLCPHGTFSIASESLGPEKLSLALAVDIHHPVESENLLLYLKTDSREIYEAARTRHSNVDEVLLVNSRGELTEGSYNSVVLEMGGEMLTPPLSSGLLPGIFRESLLECGKIKEKVLYPDDLERAETIWLINAVRGWRRGILTAE